MGLRPHGLNGEDLRHFHSSRENESLRLFCVGMITLVCAIPSHLKTAISYLAECRQRRGRRHRLEAQARPLQVGQVRLDQAEARRWREENKFRRYLFGQGGR